MLLRHLTLNHLRNLDDLEMELAPGLTIVHGDNAQGKSNLLEGIYLLSIGKSYRSQTERELVSWASGGDGIAVVAGTVERLDGMTELRVGLDTRGGGALHKRIRVNGVAKRASDLVGVLNAVLFSAEDIDLVFGPPQGRRRYLDVLLSQTSTPYLRALQRYQRVLTQRNHLLRNVRDGRSNEGELEFWDAELCREGAAVLAARLDAAATLAALITETFQRFAVGDAALEVGYASTVPVDDGASAEAMEGAMAAAIAAAAVQERSAGQTLVGPHRDDLRITQHGVEFGRHASRGQARLAALSLRLAEARLLHQRRGEPPVLLLDDILSELDVGRREMVMAEAASYPQTILTTADLGLVPAGSVGGARVLRMVSGRVLEEASA